MIERIKQIMAFHGMSINSFALKIGANQVTLNQQMNGDRKISLDTVLKICSTFKLVSSDWVLFGEGSMLKSSSSSDDSLSLIEDLKAENNRLKGENSILREQAGLGERKELSEKSA